ncbi:MAG TPA: hypothetical protein VKK79_08670 [Candidatus Lokiarchaeia archaeon]|nr:hypothetical protein [Candidatus Lokiarchaeia archaeon]
MKEVYIIDQRAGTAIYHKSFSSLKVDPDLISGLLTAMNQLTEVEMAGRGIEAIVMGGLHWIYTKYQALNLLIIAADTRDHNIELTRSRLEFIIKTFVEFFQITPENWEQTWYGEYSKFHSFDPICEQLIQQWTQAEGVLGAAELFDILGIYQQILNILMNITRRNFFKEKLDTIKGQMQEYYANLSEQVKDDPELSKIKFNELDWDFMMINPLNVDGNKLRQILLETTHAIKDFVAEGLGKMILLNEFSKELIPYLLGNWDQLAKLGFEKTLVEIFLS